MLTYEETCVILKNSRDTQHDNIQKGPQMNLSFAVRTLKVVQNPNNQLIEVRKIVLLDEYKTLLQYTDLDQFAHNFGKHPLVYGIEPAYNYEYPCVALNYIYSHYDVSSVAEITEDMVKEFFTAFPTRRGKNGDFVGEQTLFRCCYAVSHFFANIRESLQEGGWQDYLLKKTVQKKDRIRAYEDYFPKYTMTKYQCKRTELLRDIPLSVIPRLYNLAMIHDPMIAFAIVAGYTAGLRGGELVNLRQPGSPVSLNDGITFWPNVGMPDRIYIDLSTEFLLRSDEVLVGKIKKERTVEIYKDYIPEFMSAYLTHMEYLKTIHCEKEFMPMFVGRNGKAMTVRTLRNRFSALVMDYLRPELLASDDPNDVALGNLLMTRSLGLHVLRHCFTVRLVLDSGNTNVIKYYRGDSSPESADTYIRNKSLLVEQARKSHEIAVRDFENIGKGIVKGYDTGRIQGTD